MLSFSERWKQAGGVNSLGTEKQKAVSKVADFLEIMIGQSRESTLDSPFSTFLWIAKPTANDILRVVPSRKNQRLRRPPRPDLLTGTARGAEVRPWPTRNTRREHVCEMNLLTGLEGGPYSRDCCHNTTSRCVDNGHLDLRDMHQEHTDSSHAGRRHIRT